MSDLPTYDLSPEGVTEALAALGNDPEHIRTALATGGFKGITDNENCCVVANYLRAVLPGVEDVYVWQGGVWVEWSVPDPNGLDADQRHHDWYPPRSFAVFIEDYDAGKYPELIEEGTAA